MPGMAQDGEDVAVGVVGDGGAVGQLVDEGGDRSDPKPAWVRRAYC